MSYLQKIDWWLVLGFSAQFMFTCRFFVQWLASERQKKSIIPISFWYFSLIGGSLLLIYAIYRRDPVFILGQATGVFIYVRNLMFLFRRTKDKVNNSEE